MTDEAKKERRREATARWRAKNPEAARESNRLSAQNRRKANPEQTRAYLHSRYWSDPERARRQARESYVNRSEDVKAYQSEYRRSNREYVNARNSEYNRERRKTDIEFRLQGNIRSRLNSAIQSGKRNGSAIKDLGCTLAELKLHLEQLFQPGMTWENYGRYGWHIDHVEPLCSFDLTDREQLLRACHYQNLQPLWATENMKKNGKTGSVKK